MKRRMVKSAVAAAMMCGAAAAHGARPLLVGITETCQAKGKPVNMTLCTDYADAVSRCGQLPVIIPRFGTDEQIDAVLSRLDVLVLPGGGDISPERYGETSTPTLVKVNLLRDDFEWRVLALAKKRRLPVVGICRGHQVLNVFHGGSLWQDLPTQFPARNRRAVPSRADGRAGEGRGVHRILQEPAHALPGKEIETDVSSC